MSRDEALMGSGLDLRVLAGGLLLLAMCGTESGKHVFHGLAGIMWILERFNKR
jgi:hypothetical protein